VSLEQFFTASRVDRDPRGRVISIVFRGEVRAADLSPEAASDAAELSWFDVADLPEMAFDHREILRRALAGGVSD
jgi:8-oxo-dGTP diphosphatase